MKRSVKGLAGRLRGKAVAVVAAILMLFPSSACVLCVASGGHIQIEDINAGCCEHSDLYAPSGFHPDNGFDAPGYCRNCTDFFVTPNGRGALLVSSDHAFAHPLSAECLGDRPAADLSFWPCGSGRTAHLNAPGRASALVPLRC